MSYWKKNKDYRSFGLIVGGILSAIGSWQMINGEEFHLWFLGIGGGLVVTALILPMFLIPFYKVWMKLGDGLGWINSRIILSVIFYGLFTPTGLLLKVQKKDPLQKYPEPDLSSYWTKHKSDEPKESMKFQF